MEDLTTSETDGARPRQKDVLYKKDFWSTENLKYSTPHFRMLKVAHTVNKLAHGAECNLIDVGCGPAALSSLLSSNIQYYGIDIAINNPAANLIEEDFMESPIKFNDRKFDIVVAQGVFEYAGNHQDEKFSEIADLMGKGGTFVASYVNFDHRQRLIYWPYSNIQPFHEFRKNLESHFTVQRVFPTSYNWGHTDPSRRIIKAANMHMKVNIPFASRALAVEYIVICTLPE